MSARINISSSLSKQTSTTSEASHPHKITSGFLSPINISTLYRSSSAYLKLTKWFRVTDEIWTFDDVCGYHIHSHFYHAKIPERNTKLVRKYSYIFLGLLLI